MSRPSGVFRACVECGERFYCQWARRNSHLYCSRACVGRANAKRLRKFDVAKMVAAISGDACVEWPGHRDKDGYGKVLFEGRQRGVHIVAFKLANGRWAKDLVCHSCDNPSCFNPAHLSEGTLQSNAAEMASRGRACRGERSHLSKLRAEDVIAIRSDRRGSTALGKVYGVARYTIQRIRARKVWKHV